MQHTIDIGSNPTPINNRATTRTGSRAGSRPSTVTLSKRPAPETTSSNASTPAPKFARGTSSVNIGRPPSQRGGLRPASHMNQSAVTTCYVCGCEFSSAAIASHEPQCLQKQKEANHQMSVNQKKMSTQRQG